MIRNKTKITGQEKEKELKKYRDLVIATLDYVLENNIMKSKSATFDSDEYFKSLKIKTEEHFSKGRLSILRQWFRDMIEPQIETRNLNFNNYLVERTKYEIDIFKSYFERIEKIIEKGKITTDNQFYDINIMVDQLSQYEPVDLDKINTLNKLLAEYEQRKSQKNTSRPHNTG